jgi:hypothetical protein
LFLLPSIAVGLVLAWLLGGRLSRVLEVRFRFEPLVPAALALQVVLFTRLGDELPAVATRSLHLLSYALLALFAAANLRVRGFGIALAGFALNALAIAVNDGRMPLSRSAAAAAGVDPTANANVSEAAARLRWLGDVFALPRHFPLANAFSAGDVLIGVGIVVFLVVVSSEPAERLVDVRRLLEPARLPAFRRLVAGRLVSHLGDWLTLAALVGWIYASTRSTGDVALLMLARLAPPILGSGTAALVLDRLPKGRVLVWVELARGGVVIVALAGVMTSTTPLVFAALACSGALVAVANAAGSALVPTLLPGEQLAQANAGVAIAKDAAMAVGAATAGALLASAGAATALVVDLGTFAAAAALFTPLRLSGLPPRERRPRERVLSGVRHVLTRRRLVVLVLAFAAATTATGLANATLPRFLAGSGGLGAGGYGFGMAALATGLTLGELVVGLMPVRPEGGRWIGAGLLAMAGLFLGLAGSTHGATALLALGAIGFVDGTTDVLYDTALQQEVDPDRQGAAFGFSSTLITTTMMAAFAGAPLANRLLPAPAVLVAASLFLVVAGTIALVGLRGAGAALRGDPRRSRADRRGGPGRAAGADARGRCVCPDAGHAPGEPSAGRGRSRTRRVELRSAALGDRADERGGAGLSRSHPRTA